MDLCIPLRRFQRCPLIDSGRRCPDKLSFIAGYGRIQWQVFLKEVLFGFPDAGQPRYANPNVFMRYVNPDV